MKYGVMIRQKNKQKLSSGQKEYDFPTSVSGMKEKDKNLGLFIEENSQIIYIKYKTI